MGQYEPEDSRVVTHSAAKDSAGLKPTGAMEDQVRDEAIRRKKMEAAGARDAKIAAAAEDGRDDGPKSGGADFASDTGKPAEKF